MRYAQVVLPLKIEGAYHYSIPPEWQDRLRVGHRVVVSLGTKRFYTGVVSAIDEALPPEVVRHAKQIKPITDVPDEHPLLTPKDLKLWEWVAHYYLCTLGDVLRMALPAALLPASATSVSLNENFVSAAPLTEVEQRLLDLLAMQPQSKVPMATLQRLLGQPAVKAFTHLVEIGALTQEETLVRRYKPKTETYLSLSENYRTDEALERAAEELNRAKKQQTFLYEWLEQLENEHADYYTERRLNDVTAGSDARSRLVRELCRRGIFCTTEHEVSRLTAPISSGSESGHLYNLPPLNLSPGVSFLYTRNHRVKEEAIIRLCCDTLAQGHQVLLITPLAGEVQTKGCFTACLSVAVGERLWLYDSTQSDARRVEIFLRLAHNHEPRVIMGQRSALFLPMRNLGLIIVDEEHEFALKQRNTAPRCHSRDVAIWMGAQRQLAVCLTSETPSAETLFNVKRGKYHLLDLRQVAHPPTRIPIQVVNLQKVGREVTVISPQLYDAIRETLSQGQRVMLLQNRRGYAPYLICRACGGKIQCPNCDVSLTYHRHMQRMVCHYCGYNIPMPYSCPSCHAAPAHPGKEVFMSVGYGSERVEEEVRQLFPEARVLRLDSDVMLSVKQRREVQELIDRAEVDIVVGTQLIKGQPIWDNVSLIGVIRLDVILAYPDFRSYERAYQLLDQLILRLSESGTSDARMLVQTYDSDNPFISLLQSGNYGQFILEQLQERKLCQFPPFVRMTVIELRAFDEELVEHCAVDFSRLLGQNLPAGAVSAPQKPSVARQEMQYIRQIVLKRQPVQDYRQERTAYQKALDTLMEQTPSYHRVRILPDVDPI